MNPQRNFVISSLVFKCPLVAVAQILRNLEVSNVITKVNRGVSPALANNVETQTSARNNPLIMAKPLIKVN